MRIIEETELDFSDLLISPKRSTLNSRSEVSLFRTFRWTGLDGKTSNTLECIPIIASNMATTGTPEMAKILVKRGFMCCMEKHIPIEELCGLYYDLENSAMDDGKLGIEYIQRIVPSIGIKESLDGLNRLADEHCVTCVCVDVPNGYIPNFMTRVKEVVELLPNALVFAGNVVTGDICQDIILAGGNVAKVGIGSGCFVGSTKILTKNGLKRIQDIDIGEYVLTHNGIFEKVVNKFTYSTHRHVIDVNGIKCTPNHKFYAAKTEDLAKIDGKNYKDYCTWIEAEDLDAAKYKLLKLAATEDGCAAELVGIVKSEIQDNDKKTYDLEVENAHSYNVEGIIVHNSGCTTRKKTGVGRPQASAVIECADACHQVDGFCCSDGGCTTPSDIVKAFGCGADFVMLGGMFAGVEEAAGETVEVNGKRFKQFYGMSSNLAQEKHFGGVRSYSTAEGREVLVPVTGTLDEVLDDIEGGIKSAMCYIGARRLKNIPKNCTFYKVHNQLNTKFANCQHIK